MLVVQISCWDQAGEGLSATVASCEGRTNEFSEVRMAGRKSYFVYIMANEARTIYVGVTSDLEGRVWEHRNGALKGFTSRYGLTRLVYFEEYGDIRDAIDREKQLKGFRRSKKVALITVDNPCWDDLARDWFG